MTFDPSLAFVTCPKNCDVATPPEPLGDHKFVCSACGHIFEFQARASQLEPEGRRRAR